MRPIAALVSPCAIITMLGVMGPSCHKRENTVDNADEESQELATDGGESAAASAQSTHLGNIVFSAVASQDPAIASSNLSASTKLWPPGCVTRAKDMANPLLVHMTFNECTGPFGLVHLNGVEDVTFSKSPNGGLRATLQSVNLSANGKPVNHTATADITVMGADRQVVWNGHWARTTEKGIAVDHESSLTIQVDITTECRTSTGTAKATVGAREVDTEINEYKVCRNPATSADECPTGTVTHTAKSTGRTLTVDFDGSNEATVEAQGKSFSIPLVCGG
jgi:hypothetical protein